MSWTPVGASHVAPGDISIIVPVGLHAPAWVRSAASLGRLDPPPGEIIVVLDGPNSAAASAAEAIGAAIITLGTPAGPARARNVGVLSATREVLLFLDADVEVPSGLVASFARALSAPPRVTAIMGSYDVSPAASGFVSQYRNLLHHYVHQSSRAQASTFWAGCGAIWRRTYLEAGGFDEGFCAPSVEDIELGARLRRAGHEIRLDPSLQVTHLKDWRFRGMLATDLWRRAVPWTEMMLRNGRWINDLNVDTRNRVSVMLAFAAPVALLLTAWSGEFAAVAAGAVTGMLLLNLGFFRFLARERGLMFAARALPLHWLYLIVCGLGFGVGVARHFLSPQRTIAAGVNAPGRLEPPPQGPAPQSPHPRHR
jgi:glycosyltransferase involved in cell wall biosynthesis